MSGLILHAGAEPVSYQQLREMQTPDATETHVPIPHYRLVDLVKHTAAYYGHAVHDEHYGVTQDGNKFFAMLALRSEYDGYEDALILRNSHNKTFPAAVGMGSHVFCCDNMAFYADVVIKRKHTMNLKRDLPGLIGEVLEPLADQRKAQANKFLRYRSTALTQEQVHDAIMRMYRLDIINVTRIPDVLTQWDNPAFPAWGEGTAWTLFNATTYALTGKVAENPNTTRSLHAVIDVLCDKVH